MDFTQSMDNGYMIPSSIAVGSGEATDIRCVCDTVEDFKTFLSSTGMDLRYEGLVTYEKVNKLLKVYKGDDTWQTVGEGGGNADTSSFITLTQLSQQLSNYYTKSQTDSKIVEEIAKAQIGGSGEVDLSSYATKNYVDDEISRIELKEGPQGLKGEDGLTTSILVNGQTYTHVDGVITLPNYPNNAGGNIDTISLTDEQIKQMINSIDIPVSELSMNKQHLKLKEGEYEILSFSWMPSYVSQPTVIWESNNPSVAEVNQEGKVTAVAEGEALITITSSNGISTNCGVVVEAVEKEVVLQSISLNQTSLSLHSGDTTNLVATFNPSDATYKAVSWSTNNDQVATVSGGKVTCVGEGSCVITCTSNQYPSIKAECSVEVTELKTLTSVVNGLEHSYSFAGLATDDSTTIEDLTGTTPVTMANFTNVAAAKTAYGIIPDQTSSRLNQNSMCTSNTTCTIVTKMKGASISYAGVWGTSGIKLCNNSNGQYYQFTDGGYLNNSLSTTSLSEQAWDVVAVSFDFGNSLITTYVNGVKRANTTMSAKVVWNNKLAIFDGYSTNNNVTNKLCINSLLIYNRCITDEEAVTIYKDLVGDSRFIGLDLTRSVLSTANRKDLCFELSHTNNVSDNVLTSAIDSTKTIPVASVTEKGFTVSEPVLVDKPLLGIRTAGLSFYFDSSLDTTTSETVFLNKFTANSARSYIQNSKIYIRTDNAWALNNMAETLVTGVNTIFITYAHYSGNIVAENISIYVNGVKYSASHVFPFTYNNLRDFMNYLSNTTIPIQSYLVFDKALTQEEITALDNDLKGVE